VEVVREGATAMTDQERERLIEAWRVVVELDAQTYKATGARRMQELINHRSPVQVELMERERGLRAS